MIACPYQDVFPYIIDALHVKRNTEWNEKEDKLKEIEPDTQSWKKNNRYRKDKTNINRLRTDHTLLTHGYLMEGLPMSECELYHRHALNVKHLFTDCVNLVSLRLRFFDGTNTNTLKKTYEEIK